LLGETFRRKWRLKKWSPVAVKNSPEVDDRQPTFLQAPQQLGIVVIELEEPILKRKEYFYVFPVALETGIKHMSSFSPVAIRQSNKTKYFGRLKIV
jgi:hypothetical protein